MTETPPLSLPISFDGRVTLVRRILLAMAALFAMFYLGTYHALIPPPARPLVYFFGLFFALYAGLSEWQFHGRSRTVESAETVVGSRPRWWSRWALALPLAKSGPESAQGH
ncbi:hypothetical protein [Caulobacter sp. LARHSG274]